MTRQNRVLGMNGVRITVPSLPTRRRTGETRTCSPDKRHFQVFWRGPVTIRPGERFLSMRAALDGAVSGIATHPGQTPFIRTPDGKWYQYSPATNDFSETDGLPVNDNRK